MPDKPLFNLLITLAFTVLSFQGNAQNTSFYEVTDSFGKHQLTEPPERVVVADWALLEQILELGIVPVGGPELDRYRHYVRQPRLPGNITDIGLRRAPNLQIIRDLKPDVIIVGTDQKSLARPFSHIATVMYYKNFSDKYRTNGKKTRERFVQIAELFQKQELARTKLEELDKEMALIKQQIQKHFNGKPPRLTLIRFSSVSKCLVYGANSIPLYTMKNLGLAAAKPSPRTKWGEQEISIDKLAAFSQDTILYIEPVDGEQVIFSSEAWTRLLNKTQGNIYPMQAVWSYGGAMSVLYTARAIRDALLSAPLQSGLILSLQQSIQ